MVIRYQSNTMVVKRVRDYKTFVDSDGRPTHTLEQALVLSTQSGNDAVVKAAVSVLQEAVESIKVQHLPPKKAKKAKGAVEQDGEVTTPKADENTDNDNDNDNDNDSDNDNDNDSDSDSEPTAAVNTWLGMCDKAKKRKNA